MYEKCVSCVVCCLQLRNCLPNCFVRINLLSIIIIVIKYNINMYLCNAHVTDWKIQPQLHNAVMFLHLCILLLMIVCS